MKATAYFLLLGYLCSQNTIFSKENNFVVISLGIRCTPAAQIEKYGLKSGSYPFDWNDTNFDALIAILQNDFTDFCLLGNIVESNFSLLYNNGTRGNFNFIVDKKCKIALRHDW